MMTQPHPQLAVEPSPPRRKQWPRFAVVGGLLVITFVGAWFVAPYAQVWFGRAPEVHPARQPRMASVPAEVPPPAPAHEVSRKIEDLTAVQKVQADDTTKRLLRVHEVQVAARKATDAAASQEADVK